MALVLSDPGDEANFKAVVTVTFDDGTQARVLTSDEGELSFTPGEFVSLTQGRWTSCSPTRSSRLSGAEDTSVRPIFLERGGRAGASPGGTCDAHDPAQNPECCRDPSGPDERR